MTAAFDVVERALAAERAWVVGGAVRDAELGLGVRDVDVVIDGDARAAARAVSRAAGGHVFELSDAFGAWRVVAPDRSWQVDVVPLAASSLEDDLARRDFTINAVARPVSGGPAIDPLGGLDDLGRRVLRMAGEQAFSDDPLRTLRLVRFAAVFDLDVDPETLAAAQANAPAIESVAGERIFAELRSVVASSNVIAALELMDRIGLTEHVLPALAAMRGVEQNRFHHLDVHDHTISVLTEVLRLEREPEHAVGDLAPQVSDHLARPLADELTRGTALRLGALFHDVAKPDTQALAEDGTILGFPGHAELGAEQVAAAFTELRTSDRLRSHVAALTRCHLYAGYLVHEAPLSARAIHRYLVATGDVAVDVTLLSIADRLATGGRNADLAIPRHLEVARTLLEAALRRDREGEPSPLIRGDDLARALGIERGPRLGELLAEIAEARYAGEVATAAEAVEHARARLGAGDG